MQEQEFYDNPLEFQGFRFVAQRDGVNTSTSRLSHPSPQFPVWGAVGRAWCVLPTRSMPSYVEAFAYISISPGRFYVSMVAKLVLVHVIKHCEIKLANEDAKPHLALGVEMIPNPRLKFLIRKRRVELA